jgi:hypothetical protein
VGRRCKAKDVVAVLTSLYPTSACIRSDNGHEFIAQALRGWCEASGTTSTAYIEPRSLWEMDLLSRSMAGCGMNSSTLSCSPQLRKRRSWPIAGAKTIDAQATLGTPRAYASESSSTGSCRMTKPTHSHKPWTNKGGHVMWRHPQGAGCHSLRLLRSSRQDGAQTAQEGRQ